MDSDNNKRIEFKLIEKSNTEITNIIPEDKVKKAIEFGIKLYNRIHKIEAENNE